MQRQRSGGWDYTDLSFRNGRIRLYRRSSVCTVGCFGKLTLSDGIAGKYQGKYYLSAETGKGKQLLVYDTAKRLWHKEDDTQMLLAAPGGGQLYYVDQDKNVRTITGGMSWSNGILKREIWKKGA